MNQSKTRRGEAKKWNEMNNDKNVSNEKCPSFVKISNTFTLKLINGDKKKRNTFEIDKTSHHFNGNMPLIDKKF